jgi:hypothetical protein
MVHISEVIQETGDQQVHSILFYRNLGSQNYLTAFLWQAVFFTLLEVKMKCFVLPIFPYFASQQPHLLMMALKLQWQLLFIPVSKFFPSISILIFSLNFTRACTFVIVFSAWLRRDFHLDFKRTVVTFTKLYHRSDTVQYSLVDRYLGK